MSNIKDGPRDRFQYDADRIAEDATRRREAAPTQVTITEPDHYPTYDLLRFAVSDPRFGTEPSFTAKVWAKMERSKEHLTKPKANVAVTVEVLRPNLDTLPEDHVFRSREELFAAQADPRFQKDQKYTLWVWHCMDNSHAKLFGREMR